MKIFVINPDYGMSDEALRKRERMLMDLCGPGTTVDMQCLQSTQVYIDSLTDVALASPEVLQMAIKAQQDGYDAVVLYCFSDPAIAACREVLRIPVVGSGQASLLLAAGLGYRLSLLTTMPARNREKRHFIRAMGVGEDRIASVRSADVDKLDLETQREQILDEIVKVARECVELDGADTVVLGCLTYAGLGGEISKRAGVPVVDPAHVGILTAQNLVKMGLCHSPLAYPTPPSLL